MYRATSIALLLLTACGDDGTAPPPDAGVEPVTRCGDDVAVADLATGIWDPRFTIAGFSGHDGIAPTVHDFAIDADGALVATGRFQWIGSDRVEPLVRWTGAAWEPARETWELPAPLDGFSAIAIDPLSGGLALATNDSFGERDGEIWIDDGTGLRTVGAFAGQVRTLAWFDGDLWAAGLFELDGVGGLAVWDGAAWSAPPGGGIGDGAAFELLVDGGTLVVGGMFETIGGIDARSIAGFDGATWTDLGLPETRIVYALARDADGLLYAGGALGFQGGGQTGGLVRRDGDTWTLVGGGLAIGAWGGVVTDLVAQDGAIVATGCFDTAGAVAARSVARWDGADWSALDDDTQGVLAPWFQPAVCGDEGPTAIWDVAHQRVAAVDGRVVLGGSFPGAGGVLSQAVIAYEDGAWQAQGQSGLGIGGALERVAVGGASCEAYGIGMQTHAAGERVDARLLHFTGDGWRAIGDELPADAWCPALDVSAGGDVVVGCTVFSGDGAEGRLLRADGDALVAIDAELGPVHSIQFDGDALWIAGGAETGYLARLDGDTVTVVEDGFDGVVTRVAPVGDDVVVGGSFLHVDDVAATRVARWDGSVWHGLGDGVPGQVVALARDGDRVYLSTYDEGAGAYLLGLWDGAAWQELASPAANLTPQTYFTFDRIVPISDALVLVGTAELDDRSGRGALVLQDGRFTALAGGVRAMFVSGVAIADDAVWFAGAIAEVGDATPSVGVARLGLD
jgi:hypothetical protein